MTQRTIVVKNFATVIGDKDVRHVLPALHKQLNRDFAPYYGGAGTLHFVGKDAAAPPDALLFYFFDDADVASALGYHDLGADGQPLSKVFVKTTTDDGASWTVCASHELLEMTADPNINLCAFDEEHGRLYAYEPCDANEADEFGYDVDGVHVSDFVLPGWFEPTHVAPGERFAFKSPITAPFQLLPGGYISFFDIARRRWSQINARTVPVNARTADKKGFRAASEPDAPADIVPLDQVKSRRGARRARRLKPRHTWAKSTAQ